MGGPALTRIVAIAPGGEHQEISGDEPRRDQQSHDLLEGFDRHEDASWSPAQSAPDPWNDEQVHQSKAQQAGNETFPNHGTKGALLIEIADQQFEEPEQSNLDTERVCCKARFAVAQARQSDHEQADEVKRGCSKQPFGEVVKSILSDVLTRRYSRMNCQEQIQLRKLNSTRVLGR